MIYSDNDITPSMKLLAVAFLEWVGSECVQVSHNKWSLSRDGDIIEYDNVQLLEIFISEIPTT
jgi:hypothetical protein